MSTSENKILWYGSNRGSGFPSKPISPDMEIRKLNQFSRAELSKTDQTITIRDFIENIVAEEELYLTKIVSMLEEEFPNDSTFSSSTEIDEDGERVCVIVATLPSISRKEARKLFYEINDLLISEFPEAATLSHLRIESASV